MANNEEYRKRGLEEPHACGKGIEVCTLCGCDKYDQPEVWEERHCPLCKMCVSDKRYRDVHDINDRCLMRQGLPDEPIEDCYCRRCGIPMSANEYDDSHGICHGCYCRENMWPEEQISDGEYEERPHEVDDQVYNPDPDCTGQDLGTAKSGAYPGEIWCEKHRCYHPYDGRVFNCDR